MRGEQDGTTGRLVDTAALHADEATLDDVDAADAVLLAEAIGLLAAWRAELLAVDAGRVPSTKSTVTFSARAFTVFTGLVSLCMLSSGFLAGSSRTPSWEMWSRFSSEDRAPSSRRAPGCHALGVIDGVFATLDGLVNPGSRHGAVSTSGSRA